MGAWWPLDETEASSPGQANGPSQANRWRYKQRERERYIYMLYINICVINIYIYIYLSIYLYMICICDIYIYILWLKKRVWIATRWSGHVERTSCTNDLKWIQSLQKGMDRGYGSPVPPGYEWGPYILSCGPYMHHNDNNDHHNNLDNQNHNKNGNNLWL